MRRCYNRRSVSIVSSPTIYENVHSLFHCGLLINKEQSIEYCSLLFKYALSARVRRKCEDKVSWAAVARVSEEVGFKGVMIIRYSIVPPRESGTCNVTFFPVDQC
jgi:hypothetical protein